MVKDGRPIGALGAVALATVLAVTPALAQPADEVSLAAGVNADTVDGKHAVSATGKPGARKNRLVAFSAKGYLPDNVIRKARDADRLDGLDSTAFATLAALQGLTATLQSPAGAVNEADNPVHWNQLQGVPPTIADGVDEGRGYVSTVLPGTYTVPAQAGSWVIVTTTTDTDIEVTLIPTQAFRTIYVREEAFELRPNGELRRHYFAWNDYTLNSVSFRVRVRVFNQGISTAALKKAARNLEVTVSRKKPGRR